jgi:hypothetical protein
MMTALTQVIIDWIKSMGWDDSQEIGWPLLPGPYQPNMPERVVVITGTGGPGYAIEGATDVATWQAYVRGPALDTGAAEDAAQRLDELVFHARLPAVIDGVRIIHADRAGSRPTPLPFSPDGMRAEVTCNYLTEIAAA